MKGVLRVEYGDYERGFGGGKQAQAAAGTKTLQSTICRYSSTFADIFTFISVSP